MVLMDKTYQLTASLLWTYFYRVWFDNIWTVLLSKFSLRTMWYKVYKMYFKLSAWEQTEN